jgi:two-component system KDP operon response regulator KdpE
MHKRKNTALIVDSDPQLQKMMSTILDPRDFKTVKCSRGCEAARLNALIKPDLVFLDLTLSDMEGKDVITAIREHSQVPIIILTERNEDSDVIMAMKMGVNDYINKPFNAEVLLARVYNSLRKFAVNEAGVSEITNGPLRMDLVRHEVFLDDKLLSFTPKEYDLLHYFIIHRGKMLTHKQILKEVWGLAHYHDMQYLRVYVGQVRAKIEKAPKMPTISRPHPALAIGWKFQKMWRCILQVCQR